MSDARKDNKRFAIGLPLITSIIVHITIIALIGGVVLFPGYVQNAPFVGSIMTSETEIEPPPPEMEMPMEEDAGGGGDSGLEEAMDLQKVADIETPDLNMDVLTSTSLDTAVALPSGGVSGMAAIGRGALGTGGGSGGGQGGGIGKGIGKGTSMFGSSQVLDNALEGVFWDMKQDKQGNKLQTSYQEVFSKFISSGFKRETMKKFFESSTKLYATQIFIPKMPANVAPQAFQAEVEPSMWLIHYRGTIQPPSKGKYRFVGAADDLMVVAINKKVVHCAGWGGKAGFVNKDFWEAPMAKLHSKGLEQDRVPMTPAAIDLIKNPKPSFDKFYTAPQAGNWINLQASKSYEIDILVSEIPGGAFSMWLYAQKKDAPWEPGTPLPIFSLAQELGDLPKTNDKARHPGYDKSKVMFMGVK